MGFFDYMGDGWIKLHRKTLDSSVWKNPKILTVWVWCLLKANHKKSKFPFNGSDIELTEGQFITGLFACKKEIRCLSLQSIRTAWTYLKSTNRITIQSNNKYSLITIVNWDEYQSDNNQTNKPVTNEQQTSNKPTTTNKNVNNEKNDNKIIGEKTFKDGTTKTLHDGTKAVLRFGVWCDATPPFPRLDRNYYKELP